MRNKIKKRIVFLITFIILLVIEVLIALYVQDDFIRPYVGDILVVVLLYYLVRIFLLEKAPFLPLYLFLFAAGIELLQYFQFVELLGLQNNTFARILLGSVFDWRDIGCYAIGCILISIFEKIIYKFYYMR